jgi:hypothetical protein
LALLLESGIPLFGNVVFDARFDSSSTGLSMPIWSEESDEKDDGRSGYVSEFNDALREWLRILITSIGDDFDLLLFSDLFLGSEVSLADLPLLDFGCAGVGVGGLLSCGCGLEPRFRFLVDDSLVVSRGFSEAAGMECGAGSSRFFHCSASGGS